MSDSLLMNSIFLKKRPKTEIIEDQEKYIKNIKMIIFIFILLI